MSVEAATKLIKDLNHEIWPLDPERFDAWCREGHLHEFTEELTLLEPFAAFRNAWIRWPSRGGMSARNTVGPWVAERLQAGRPATEIVRTAQDSVARNSYTTMMVVALKGVSVDRAFSLTDDIAIRPNIELPHHQNHQRAFGEQIGGFFADTDTAALTVNIKIEPALVPIDKRPEFDGDEPDPRSVIPPRVRLGLGLISTGPVEIGGGYHQADPADILSFRSGSFYWTHMATPSVVQAMRVDPTALPQWLDRLDNMQSGSAIELALDRLLRSRAFRTSEDRIIDLGMAAEIALMHSAQRGDGKGEITNKLSTRGAWLVGKSLEERQGIARILKDLYSARSIVVHTGRASHADADRLQEYGEIVGRLLRALLERGSFPDWSALILGG